MHVTFDLMEETHGLIKILLAHVHYIFVAVIHFILRNMAILIINSHDHSNIIFIVLMRFGEANSISECESIKVI